MFFLSLGLVGRAGSDLLSSAEAPIAVLGTLVASLTSIVIVAGGNPDFWSGVHKGSPPPTLASLATLAPLLAAVGLAAVLETDEDVLSVAMLAILVAVAAFERGVTKPTVADTGR